jgi:hypothetical protein
MNVIPGKEYTRDEIAQLRDHPDTLGLVLQGYVLVVTEDLKFSFVHQSKAAGGGYKGTGTGEVTKFGGGYGKPTNFEFDKQQLPDIVKRTPQQRMDSLMKNAGEDLRAYLAGKRKRDLDGEELKTVARENIETAEVNFTEAERKKIVRTTGSPKA